MQVFIMGTTTLSISEAARRVAQNLTNGRFVPTANMLVRPSRTLSGRSTFRFDTLGKIANLTGVTVQALRGISGDSTLGQYITAMNLNGDFTAILSDITYLNDVFVRQAHYNTASTPGKRLVGELVHFANKYDKWVRESVSTKKNKKSK